MVTSIKLPPTLRTERTHARIPDGRPRMNQPRIKFTSRRESAEVFARLFNFEARGSRTQAGAGPSPIDHGGRVRKTTEVGPPPRLAGCAECREKGHPLTIRNAVSWPVC
jgi:hypothetical protein